MKLRTDIVKMYKEIHGWVGIVSGLGLFIAFFAGALTMFDAPIKRWASAPSSLPAPIALERSGELVDKVIAAHPKAAKGYTIQLTTDTGTPARLEWEEGERGHGSPRTKYHAGLAKNGALVVVKDETSPVPYFVDVLHQQIGIMLDHELAMPIMGGVALLYFIALVSGTIVLLPSLVKDLYALRIGKNAKRMWLDLHNMLGIFSLPFHIVMALSSVVFAFHDQFYDAQALTFAQRPERAAAMTAPPPKPASQQPIVTPVAALASLTRELPGFTPSALAYGTDRKGQPSLRVMGADPRYGQRGPGYTLAILDPHSGKVTGKDYLGGVQDGWGASVTSFFALHFGSFGGAPVRWAYFLLGLSGAAIFYTGNLLWVESRRRRERKAGAVEQTRATRVLAALTVGVPLGCIAGIAVTLAAAKPLGTGASLGLHSAIYHAIFFACVLWALVRGSARGAIELLPGAAIACLSVPAMTLATWQSHPPREPGVDAVAAIMAFGLLWAWRSTLVRARSGPRDSVWSAPALERSDDPLAQPAE